MRWARLYLKNPKITPFKLDAERRFARTENLRQACAQVSKFIIFTESQVIEPWAYP